MDLQFLSSIHKNCSKCLEEIRKILNLTVSAFAFEINYSTSGYRRLVGLDCGFKIDSAIHFDMLKIVNSIITNIHNKLMWKNHKNEILKSLSKYAMNLID